VKKSLNQRIALQRFGVRQSPAALDFYATYGETNEAASFIPIGKIRAHFPKPDGYHHANFLGKWQEIFPTINFFAAPEPCSISRQLVKMICGIGGLNRAFPVGADWMLAFDRLCRCTAG
jgi:hypothetical protein